MFFLYVLQACAFNSTAAATVKPACIAANENPPAPANRSTQTSGRSAELLLSFFLHLAVMLLGIFINPVTRFSTALKQKPPALLKSALPPAARTSSEFGRSRPLYRRVGAIPLCLSRESPPA